MDGNGAAALFDARAELFESKFGVITGLCGLGDLCLSLRIQPGEKNGGLHLGAGHGHLVMDGAELAPVDFERGKIVVLGANVGAHLAKRGDNALHRAFLERSIPGNSGGEFLSAEDAGKQADGGAGIFRVE